MNIDPSLLSTAAPLPYPGTGSPAPSSPDVGNDLFGSDEEDEPAPVVAPSLGGSDDDEQDDGLTDEERARRLALEYEEADEPAAGLQPEDDQLEAQLPLPNYPIPLPASTGAKVWHARLPNFLQIESKPFDTIMWEPPEEAEASRKEQEREQKKAAWKAERRAKREARGEDSDQESDGNFSEEERKAQLKKVLDGEYKPTVHLPDENIIRWQWVKAPDGSIHKRSNARFIRWSDGTQSLQVGSELFDVSSSLDQSAMRSGPPQGGAAPVPDGQTSHGLTYLVARQQQMKLLEAQAAVHGSMTFRPTTITSNAHRRLVGSIQGRYKKEVAVKQTLTEADPEKVKAEKEKKALEAARRKKRLAKGGEKKKKNAEKSGRKIAEGVFSSDEEGDDDERMDEEDAEGEADEDGEENMDEDSE